MLVPIDSPADPRVADYANLRDRQLAARAGLGDRPGVFLAEGELVVRTLIDSGRRVRSVLITPTRLESMRDAIDRLPAEVPVYLAGPGVMDGVVGFHIHRGVLAAGDRWPEPTLAEVLARATRVLVLEGLANHDNVGGLFRVAAALGGVEATAQDGGASSERSRHRAAVVLSPGTCDPLYRKAIRVSMGSALRVPFATATPWPAVLADVRRAGFRLVALTPGAGAVPIERLDPSGPRVAVMLGAEGPGLSAEAMAMADVRVRIPIDPSVDSLNVVTAGAIALHRLRG
ncbi:MAG: RNA methyltransferase [Phycisphaerae bacterium]|nr:RNA methyltransferase [Phycisphaerae bacterium]